MDILFDGGPTKFTRARVGTVSLDASVTEDHDHAAEVTEHPVEDGGNVADHVSLSGAMLTIQGVVTNTPITVPETQADGVSEQEHEFSWQTEPDAGLVDTIVAGIGSLIGVSNIQTATARTFGPQFDRVSACHLELKRLMNERQPFTIITSLETYENCVLVGYKPTRDAARGNALHFTATAKQVRIVKSEVAEALPDPSELRAMPEANKGSLPAKEASTGVGTKSSLLLQGFQAGGILR